MKGTDKSKAPLLHRQITWGKGVIRVRPLFFTDGYPGIMGTIRIKCCFLTDRYRGEKGNKVKMPVFYRQE